MPLLIPISWGELFDKITILEIKANSITDSEKLSNINKELAQLTRIANQTEIDTLGCIDIINELKKVNEQLWKIEDAIRICENEKKFNTRFIELARSVYITNDKRASLKYQLNQMLGSEIVEEKSYEPYEPQNLE
jgi:hypothetical protein